MELSAELEQKINTYKPDPAKLATIKDEPLVFLVGITGSGKNAILQRLLQKYPQEYQFIVSHTTRARRKNNGIMEQDGVEYNFVDIPTIERMIADKDFIEVQVVHAPKIYGTSVEAISAIQQNGKSAVSDIDIQGTDEYVKMGLNVKPIFILPPNFDEWSRRFAGRYGNEIPLAEIRVRLESAVREIEHALSVDYFYFVINDQLEQAVDRIHDITQGEPAGRQHDQAIETAKRLLGHIRAKLAEL